MGTVIDITERLKERKIIEDITDAQDMFFAGVLDPVFAESNSYFCVGCRQMFTPSNGDDTIYQHLRLNGGCQASESEGEEIETCEHPKVHKVLVTGKKPFFWCMSCGCKHLTENDLVYVDTHWVGKSLREDKT